MTIWAGVALGLVALVVRWRTGRFSGKEAVLLAIVLGAVSIVQLLLYFDMHRFIWDRRYQEPNVVPLLAFTGAFLAAVCGRFPRLRVCFLVLFALLFVRHAYRAKVMYTPGRLNAYVLESSSWAAKVINEDWKGERYEQAPFHLHEHMTPARPTIASYTPLVPYLAKGRWLGPCEADKSNPGELLRFPLFPDWRENPDYVCDGTSSLRLEPEYVLVAERRFSRSTMRIFRRRAGVERFPKRKVRK